MTKAEQTEQVEPQTETAAPTLTVDPRVMNPTPVEYPVGHVKQDTVTLAVAVRTNIIDPENRKDWGLMSIDRGGMYATWDQISAWPDLTPLVGP
jgi:hypothetical protein